MFQHRHYKAIADLLADLRDIHPSGQTTIIEIEDDLVKLFKRDNAGFKPDRFRMAARRATKMHGKDRVN